MIPSKPQFKGAPRAPLAKPNLSAAPGAPGSAYVSSPSRVIPDPVGPEVPKAKPAFNPNAIASEIGAVRFNTFSNIEPGRTGIDAI